MMVRAYAHGRSIAVEAMTENDGSFLLEGLPRGKYAVCVASHEGRRPVCAAEIEVEDDEVKRVDLKAGRSFAVIGDSWLQGRPCFSQSYRATGLGLTMAQIKGFGPARRVDVQLLRGDGTNGRPVGPSRLSDSFGGEGSTVVAWGGGEAATVPGKMYTIKMSAYGGNNWIPSVAGGGDVFSEGLAYFGDIPSPHSDLGICICEDNDSLRTDYSLVGKGRMYRAVSLGQSFEALSRNITFASAALKGIDSAPGYIRFSIHEGGLGGRQIGPSKTVSPSSDAAVAWGPDEVVVRPGGKYYLHIESLSGKEFLAAYKGDTYSSGNAAFNGREAGDKDAVATVAGQITQEDYDRLMGLPTTIETIGLSSPFFEDGLGKWGRDGAQGAIVGCDYGVVPHWGTKMFGWTNEGKGEGARTVLYQKVKAEKGQWYVFSGWVYTDHRGGRSSDVKIRLLAAPGGRTSVRDNYLIETSQWYATEGRWRRGSVQFKAEADFAVVGFDLEQRFSLESSSLYVDGAHLQRIGGP
ncbi:MAG: hypothetical protein ACYS8Z_12850 [Planctomycetota bacterium]